MDRHRIGAVALLATMVAACGDTDVANRGEEIAPGQEIEDSGVELDVQAVELEAQPWFRQGGTVSFEGRTWLLTGEPVYDPAVEHVGEYQGTPLYAEVGTAAPYRELFIPLENDYWQMLTPATEPGEDTVTAPSRGVPGVEGEGNPTGGAGG